MERKNGGNGYGLNALSDGNINEDDCVLGVCNFLVIISCALPSYRVRVAFDILYFCIIFSGCPRAPLMQVPSCQKSKCCVPTNDDKNGGGSAGGLLGMAIGSSKSTQNTPTNSRKRPNSFVLSTGDLEENGEVQIQLTSSFPSSKHDSL